MKENGDIVQFLRQKDYEMINNNLGSGSFGKTVLLRDNSIDELFVAKKYEPEIPEIKEEFFKSFLQEIKILYKLYHRNIVRVFNYYSYLDVFTGYILMEYINGKSIGEYIKDYSDQKESVSLDNVFIQLIDGFEYLEKNSICHRDIRESNILVDSNGTVKIIDFGLGKIISPQKGSFDSFNSAINRMGVDRLPEEYTLGKYNSKTDMFYLAELFNRLLRENNIGWTFSYNNILSKMMEPSPENRFESFSKIKEVMNKKDFSLMEITDDDKQIYQNFARSIYNGISYYRNEKSFNKDIDTIILKLGTLIQDNSFEDHIVNRSSLFSIFVTCYYSCNNRYPICVNNIKSFYNWFVNLADASKHLVINNLIIKLSEIETKPFVEDIPF